MIFIFVINILLSILSNFREDRLLKNIESPTFTEKEKTYNCLIFVLLIKKPLFLAQIYIVLSLSCKVLQNTYDTYFRKQNTCFWSDLCKIRSKGDHMYDSCFKKVRIFDIVPNETIIHQTQMAYYHTSFNKSNAIPQCHL